MDAAAAPAHVRVSSLTAADVGKTVSVKGRAALVWPTQGSDDNLTFRVKFQDVAEKSLRHKARSFIPIVFMGQLAAEWTGRLRKEDYIEVRDAKVALCATADPDENPCELLADETCDFKVVSRADDAPIPIVIRRAIDDAFVPPAKRPRAETPPQGAAPAQNGPQTPPAPQQPAAIVHYPPLITSANYQYTPLADLESGKEMNVYGVVSFVQQPYKTRGTDCCMNVNIIDPSVPHPNDAIKCHLFRSAIEAFPEILCVGDIVRFHRLRVVQYKDWLQGNCGKGFSCVAFPGPGSDPSLGPRHNASAHTITPEDMEHARRLRDWAATQMNTLFEDGAGGAAPPNVTLANAQADKKFGLVCRFVSLSSGVDPPYVRLRVCDGTIPNEGLRCPRFDASPLCSQPVAVDFLCVQRHPYMCRSLVPGCFLLLRGVAARQLPSGSGSLEIESMCLGGICVLAPDDERAREVDERITALQESGAIVDDLVALGDVAWEPSQASQDHRPGARGAGASAGQSQPKNGREATPDSVDTVENNAPAQMPATQADAVMPRTQHFGGDSSDESDGGDGDYGGGTAEPLTQAFGGKRKGAPSGPKRDVVKKARFADDVVFGTQHAPADSDDDDVGDGGAAAAPSQLPTSQLAPVDDEESDVSLSDGPPTPRKASSPAHAREAAARAASAGDGAPARTTEAPAAVAQPHAPSVVQSTVLSTPATAASPPKAVHGHTNGSKSQREDVAQLVSRPAKVGASPIFSPAPKGSKAPPATQDDRKQRQARELLTVPRSSRSSASATRTLHEDKPVTKLRDIVADARQCGRARCRVSIVGHRPLTIKEFSRLVCNVCRRELFQGSDVCVDCGDAGEPKWMFAFGLTAEDDSGTSIEVIVYGEDAEVFLIGIPAGDLSVDRCTRTLIRRRLQRLVQPGVLMDCCVQWYEPTDVESVSDDGAAKRRYRIFDTMLLDEDSGGGAS